jgi:hypothetical protein
MKGSNVLVVVVSTITVIPLLLIMAVVGGYWWSNFGPFRPLTVPRAGTGTRVHVFNEQHPSASLSVGGKPSRKCGDRRASPSPP